MHRLEMNICIKIVNIQERNEKIFRVPKSNVFRAKTKTAKYEQIIDKNFAAQYNIVVY